MGELEFETNCPFKHQDCSASTHVAPLSVINNASSDAGAGSAGGFGCAFGNICDCMVTSVSVFRMDAMVDKGQKLSRKHDCCRAVNIKV